MDEITRDQDFGKLRESRSVTNVIRELSTTYSVLRACSAFQTMEKAVRAFSYGHQ